MKSNADADRNLLIGVLALQMDFIDREQLVDGMRAWMGDKSKSLDAVLAQQGAIDAETQRLLSAVVDKHIAMHNGDPCASLAKAPLGASMRRELLELGDDDIDRTLAMPSGTKASLASDRGEETTRLLPSTLPERGRFRVLREHDKGGLGTVSLALDEELHREVAVKEIQARYADDAVARERFTLEAEITGGLEHPGIVPVYGFGYYADGRPYYAMRFIRGDNLKEAIREHHDADWTQGNEGDRRVAFHRLLGHLVDVCHAIEYAHCRGVLHRDLKPGNIMLGKYGETLVVDWGLAKTSLRPESTPLTSELPLHPVYSSGTDSTRQGTQLGTPAYMSPEQAAGDLDRVDSRSDVYSLGATLYELLTGKRAFHTESVETILAKVRRGDFPRPRKVVPSTPAALEAICLKAMAQQPSDRYRSAAALAEDLEHWLADEPVAAWKEPLSVRIRRWIKRHRTLVASSAAAVGAAIVILATAVAVLNVAKNREARERQRAEANLSLAKRAVDVMLTEVASEELENVPQMEEARGNLLAKARDFYEKFREQSPDDDRLQLETALAHKRLGDILRLMDEVEASQKAYGESIELLEALHAKFPDEFAYQRQLANAKNDLGVLYKKFDRDKAAKTYDDAIRLQSDLAERYRDQSVMRQELARSYYNRGIVHSTDAGAAADAKADFLKAMRQLEQVLADQRSDADLAGCRQELARCFSNLAILQRSQGDATEARQNYARAIAAAEPLVAEFPQQRVYQKELALYYNNLSNLLASQSDEGSVEQAQETNRQALAIYERLAAPVPEIRSDLGNIHHSRGVILAKMGRADESRLEFQKAREAFEPLVAEFAEFPTYADRLGNALYELAKLDYADARQIPAGDDSPSSKEVFDRALSLAVQAAQIHRRVIDRYPNDSACHEHLRNDYFLQAWTLKQLTTLGAGEATRDLTVETAVALASASPDHADHLKLAAELFAIAASHFRDAPDLEDAARKARQDEYALRAVELLKRAIDLGYADVAGLRDALQKAANPENVFHALEGRPEFAEVVEELAE